MCSPMSLMFIRDHVAQALVDRRCILVMCMVPHICLALFWHPGLEAGVLAANLFIVLRSDTGCVWEMNVAPYRGVVTAVAGSPLRKPCSSRSDALPSYNLLIYTMSPTPLTKQYG